MYHYAYKLEHIETHEYYYGSRSCKMHPSLDGYMGSMKSWRPDKSKLIKTIIKCDFLDRKECIQHERELIIEHRQDSLNRNGHIPGVGFNTNGLGQYVDDNGKIFRVRKDDELVKNGMLKPFWAGRKHSPQSKFKMQESAKHRKVILENEKLRRESISKKMTKRTLTREHCERLSKSKMGSNNPNYGKKLKRVACPYCNKEITINCAHRYHFENCKQIGGTYIIHVNSLSNLRPRKKNNIN